MINNFLHILFEILTETFSSSIYQFFKSFKGFRTYFFGSIGGFYATKDKLLNDIDNKFIQWININIWFKIIIFILCVFLIIFLFLFLRNFFKVSWQKWILKKRESVYGNAIVILSNAYSHIHANRNKDLSIEEVQKILKEFCNKIRDIYKFKTKAKCSVSIKIIVDLNPNIGFDTQIFNLCRDDESMSRYSNIQNKTYNDLEHNIANNTCFKTIISNFFANKWNSLYFLSNDLIKFDRYENSSFDMYDSYSTEKRESEESREKYWPLNYKSELVVSISPLINEQKNKFPIIGFLCVDCELSGKDVFNKKYDVPLLLGVSDGLYDFIKSNLTKNK